VAIPSSPNARLFYRAATERYEDASVLLRLNRTTGAVYLAGYGIENMLKALIVSSVPRSQEQQVLLRFRGNQAHSYEWLLQLYRVEARVAIPTHLHTHFSHVTMWTTGIRYRPETIEESTANAFFQSADAIMQWIEGRLT
jgi:HEPN domain-containing protein